RSSGFDRADQGNKLMPMPSVLDLFSPAARGWFSGAFPVPTEVQEGGWRSVAAGHHTLMSAPTGSGKTLAAFFWCIDQLANEPVPPEAERCRVLYVSPLKADRKSTRLNSSHVRISY